MVSIYGGNIENRRGGPPSRAIERAAASRGVTLSGMTLLFSGEASAAIRSSHAASKPQPERSAEFHLDQPAGAGRALSGDRRGGLRRRQQVVSFRPDCAPGLRHSDYARRWGKEATSDANLRRTSRRLDQVPGDAWRRCGSRNRSGRARAPGTWGAEDPSPGGGLASHFP